MKALPYVLNKTCTIIYMVTCCSGVHTSSITVDIIYTLYFAGLSIIGSKQLLEILDTIINVLPIMDERMTYSVQVMMPSYR